MLESYLYGVESSITPSSGDSPHSLNRTVLVLKGGPTHLRGSRGRRLNRTFVVLKVLGRVARDGADLARIIPLWR